MKVQISSNVDSLISDVQKFQRDAPFQIAKSLTFAAKEAQKGMQDHMSMVFDRPTMWTQRSLFVKPATKTNLVASVEIKDRLPSKAPISPDELFRHQVEGGSRRRKGLEKALQSAGLISANEYVVPGGGAQMDSNGNMSRGMSVQIMSQLRLGLDPHMWSSKSKRSKKNVLKVGAMFWSRGGHLKRGVWMRAERTVVPILLVVKSPLYEPMLKDIREVGQEIVEARFPAILAQNFDEMFNGSR